MRSVIAVLPFAFLVAAGASGCSDGQTKFTGIEPNTGTFVGGEEVTLMGHHFPRGGATVRFGDKPAQPVVMESDHKIKVTTPAGDKNTNSDVTVIFDDGRAFQLKNGFRYLDGGASARDKFFKSAGESK